MSVLKDLGSARATLHICITGAAGRIAYSLIQSLAKGHVFGQDQQLHLTFMDVEQAKEALGGVVLEIQDLARNVVTGCTITTSLDEAFAGVDIAILIASVPHLKGMERADLLAANTKIFRATGEALERVAKRDIKVLVVANPCNTNALVTAKYAPSLSPTQFTGLSMLDHNRSVSQVAMKLGRRPAEVHNVTIWGNHSHTMYPDVTHAVISEDNGKLSYVSELVENEWTRGDLVKVIRGRANDIIGRRGMTTMSTGQAIADHLRDWVFGTPSDQHVSMAVPSTGEYGIPPGVFFSHPVKVSKEGKVEIVSGLQLNSFTHERLQESYRELRDEADLALKLAAQH